MSTRQGTEIIKQIEDFDGEPRTTQRQDLQDFILLILKNLVHPVKGLFVLLVADRCRRSVELRYIHGEGLVVRPRTVSKNAQRNLFTKQDRPVR